MVVDEEVDAVFAALADPTRRDILVRALVAPTSVSALAESYPMSFAAVQKHVAVLERAGLIAKIARGRERLVRGEVTRLRDVTRLLDQYERLWRDRVDRIDALLADDEGESPCQS